MHPYVTDVRDPYHNFFFDEKYAKKCYQATSNKKLDELPGKAYYDKIQEFISKTYRIYNNGVEGIRQEGVFRCSEEVCRIPAPEPFLNIDAELPYKRTSDIVNETTTREIDDKNPIVQLRRMIAECGMPNVECREKKSGELGVIDENNTWQIYPREVTILCRKHCRKGLS